MISIPNINILLKVPYIQTEPGNCGIACVAMLIAYTNNLFPEVEKLVKEFKIPENYLENIGWKHDGLIAILKRFDIQTHRAENQTFHEIIKHLEMNKPVIVSVRVPKITNLSKYGTYLPENTLLAPIGHLCVIVGTVNSTFLLHDPRNIGKYKANLTITFEDFLRIFTGRCIYLN